jgi:type IV pilus assembly protein PilZ
MSAPEDKRAGRNRRLSSRVLVHIIVQLRDAEGNVTEGVASDLSVTGMFVFTPKSLAVGTSLEIQLKLPGLPQSSVIPAHVRWVKDGGVGLQFGLLGAAETHGIVQIIAQAKKAQGAS